MWTTRLIYLYEKKDEKYNDVPFKYVQLLHLKSLFVKKTTEGSFK
jgi:hypothetical protein